MVDFEAILAARLEPDLNSGCHLWSGFCDRYGSATIGTRTYKMHRVAYEVAYGPIPKGACVLHRCDTPACCNPAHLFLGTQADNTKDALKKGRLAMGERHPGARVTLEAVDKIRSDGRSNTEWARELGVAESTIRAIRTGRSWVRPRQHLALLPRLRHTP